MSWETFNLDDDASERELKRAYARLLKLHRPDKDPEGFARINGAYEQAKLELSWRDMEAESGKAELEILDLRAEQPSVMHDAEEDDLEASGATAVAVTPVEIPEEFVQHRVKISEALAFGDAAGAEEELLLMNRICVDRPDLISYWGQIVAELFAEDLGMLARVMPHGDLLRELEFEHNHASMAVLTGWEEFFGVDSMLKFAQAILAGASRYDNFPAAMVCVRLARMLAIVYPEVAEKLANHAFAALPPDQRTWHLMGLEHSLMEAEHFGDFRKDQRIFWAQRLAAPDREWDWDNQEAMDAFHYINESARYNWQGYHLIEELLPEDLRSIRSGVQEQGRRAAIESVSTDHLSDKGFGEWGWGIGIFFAILIKILVFDGCDSSGSSSYRPTEIDMEKTRRLIEEIQSIEYQRKSLENRERQTDEGADQDR